MKQLNFEQINTQQIIDIRLQKAFQSGHLPHAINLPAKKFKSLALHLLIPSQPIVFVTDNEQLETLERLLEVAISLGFLQIDGFLLIDTVPKTKLVTSEMISADAFLKKDDNYLLLDVRPQEKVTIPAPQKNLLTKTIPEFKEVEVSLSKKQDIYLLCGSGNSATTAASYLENQGYHAIVVEGGAKAIAALHKDSK